VLAKGGRKALLAAVLAPVVDAELARGLTAALLAVAAPHLVLAQTVLAAPVLPPVVLALVLHLHPTRLALPVFLPVLEAALVLLLAHGELRRLELDRRFQRRRLLQRCFQRCFGVVSGGGGCAVSSQLRQRLHFSVPPEKTRVETGFMRVCNAPLTVLLRCFLMPEITRILFEQKK